LSRQKPFILCIDVGGPKKIGWADADGRDGTGDDLGEALNYISEHLRDGGRLALGLEAPIWTPTRMDLKEITSRRGGIETDHNRAWSAAAGACALAAALALMPWCLARIARDAGPVAATADFQRFQERGGLFLWEAFVSGKMKTVGTSHHDDARLACEEFDKRWPNLTSDIQEEPSINHAVSSAMAVGLSIDSKELVLPALVVGIAVRTGT